MDLIERVLSNFLRSNPKNSFFKKYASDFPKCCIFAPAINPPAPIKGGKRGHFSSVGRATHS